MLSVRNLTKIYKLKGKDTKEVVALDHLNLDFPDKGMVFLLGKSGSGKSTLLNTIGGLDTFDEGEIIIKGKSSKQFKQSDFDAYRNTFIGFIFQEYNILDEFTVGKNLALALELQGKRADQEAVEALLEKVDLAGYYKRNPNQLSGGQKQRVAIARALIKDPEMIMADEPTGALDSNTGKQVMDTLKKLSKEKLVIIVSHDREFAELYGDRVVELKDGKIIRDVTKKEVEADKSSSGVSFIDDKIIHIKKGQRLTKDDLTRINDMIVSNCDKEDTIISFDEVPNKQIKKTAFITDDGNREVFKDTTSDDVNVKAYNPNDLKLIRSKMKKKDAFKIGASSLKHKPIRLIFTILLSFVAFALFGLIDTMASYNVTTSTYDSLKQTKTKTLSITGVSIDDEGRKYLSVGLTKERVANLEAEFENYEFFNVIYSGEDFSVKNAEYGSNMKYSSFNERVISGILPLNEETKNKLNLTLEGSYPVADDEIVISAHVFDNIKYEYKNITSLDDLADKKLTIKGNDYKVVGIVTDDTDISRYASKNISDDIQDLSEYISYSEMNIVKNYGLVNMCYVNESNYKTMCNNNVMNKEFRYYDYADENNTHSSFIRWGSIKSYGTVKADFDKLNVYMHTYTSYWNGEETYTNTYLIKYGEFGEPQPGDVKVTWEDYFEDYRIKYKKTGYDVLNLGSEDVIVSEDFLNSYIDGDDADIQTLLDSGLTVKTDISQENGSYKVYNFNIVAVFDSKYDSDLSTYWDVKCIMSDETFENLFVGYSYTLTRMKNTGEDETLVRKLVDVNDDGFGYEIEFQATFMLNNFSKTILSLSKIFLYVGLFFAVFAGFMLMNFISTSIAYKKREIGVLRAIGAGKKDVFSIFFSESFVIALINFALAIVATFIGAYFINRTLYDDLGFSVTLLSVGIRQIILLLVISVGVAAVSTLLPVLKIARKNPVDSINNR